MIPRRPLLLAALVLDEEDTLPNHTDVKLRIQGDSVKREP